MDYLQLTIQLVGGLGLFLLGMDLLSTGMKSLAGRQMRTILERFTNTKGGGVMFGVLLTLLFQSSSAASVVMVGFVEAALLSFTNSLAVMLGTGIGTTLTAQLIAFKIGNYALLLVGVGFFMKAFSKRRWSYMGQIILGLGTLFYGMELMSSGMSPLREVDSFVGWLQYLKHPLVGILVGMVFTALIQSSAAFIGILMTVSAGGLLSISDALPLILGTNIGTTVTALLAAIPASYQGRRLAVANTFFRVAGVVLMVWVLTPWENLTIWISGANATHGRILANAHTLFNVAMALIFLPFTHLAGQLVIRIVPEPVKSSAYRLKHLTGEMLKTPGLALPFLQKEVGDMGNLVFGMVEKSLDPFFARERKVLDRIREDEKKVDFYRDEVNRYMVQLNEMQPVDEWSSEIYRLFHMVNEFEQIADIVSVNIARQADKWIEGPIQFSPEGEKELKNYHERTLKQLKRALLLVEDWKPERALRMKEKYRKYALMAFDLEIQHYKRLLSPQSASLESSKVHMELLNLLRMINSHATNIGRMVLMEKEAFEVN